MFKTITKTRIAIKKFVHFLLLIFILSLFFIRFVLGGDEDTWMIDENGTWIKHGNPDNTLDYFLKLR